MGSLHTSELSHEGIQVIAVCTIFSMLAAIAAGLRIWARRLQNVSLLFNDYFVLAAMV